MRIFTVLILLLLLFAPKKERACFDISNTMLLKAILPFFIILHHVIKIPDFSNIGVYVVAIFFFISGYGLEYKRAVSATITLPEVFSRIKKLLLPLLIPMAIYIIVRWLFEGVTLEFVWHSLLSYELVLPYTWFVLSLIQLYLMFYATQGMCNKYFRGKWFLIALFIVITVYIVILFYCHVQSTYYCSIYGFMAGVLFRHWEQKLQKLKHVSMIGVTILLISLFFIEIHPPFTMLYNSWLYLFACIMILSLVSLKNRFIDFFSKISYELYLCQGIGIYFAKLLCSSELLEKFMLTLLITIPVAYISNRLTSKLFDS